MAVSCENMTVDDPWKGVSGSLDAVGAFEDNFEPCSGQFRASNSLDGGEGSDF